MGSRLLESLLWPLPVNFAMFQTQVFVTEECIDFSFLVEQSLFRVKQANTHLYIYIVVYKCKHIYTFIHTVCMCKNNSRVP